jgi:hypothetical protein
VLNHNNQKSKLRITPLIVAAVVATVGIGSVLLAPKAQADSFGRAYVRFDHLTGTTLTGGRVCAMPSAAQLAQTETKVIVNFPTTAATDYVVNGTASNWTVDTTFESGFLGANVAVWPGIGTATNVTGKAVTFPSTNLSSSTTLYCFNFRNTNSSTPSPGATLTTSSAGGLFICIY